MREPFWWETNDTGHDVEVNDAACRRLAAHVADFLPAGDVDLQWRAFLRYGVQSGVFPGQP